MEKWTYIKNLEQLIKDYENGNLKKARYKELINLLLDYKKYVEKQRR